MPVITHQKSSNHAAYTDTTCQTNLNSSWVNYKGIWVFNIILIVALKVLFGVFPGISKEASWTLTNLTYNIISFVIFHWIIGIPFEFNQGAYDELTLWEQMDNGAQFSPSKKYFTAAPILLFLLGIHYTHYDGTTFLINITALTVNLVGKLPAMHRVRLFGFNMIHTDSI
ncbi:putative unfolded protein response protein Orm1 [Basidiobolus meristosporus CBS 931.73]|uniref:Putative unfolded protein response protein Orm1 n=1 Tax=Basidiobolus meristosporus CBS 931.73 TaxID=1314790 RepID=A0A1Y1XRG4_9FUNG|nr:putative unfolded protein response protein Orm1 [Basidiobolus meristosporus CBS 931.73]|eukprot:ORX88352.1 putative unfolded protein response protein Orm1 [Basidiobolus meristosporus CBS 931.73]